MHGIQEVVGSIPSSSTNEFKGLEGFPSKPFFVGYTKEYTSEVGVALGACVKETRYSTSMESLDYLGAQYLVFLRVSETDILASSTL